MKIDEWKRSKDGLDWAIRQMGNLMHITSDMPVQNKIQTDIALGILAVHYNRLFNR